jgi:hypothetical protein
MGRQIPGASRLVSVPTYITVNVQYLLETLDLSNLGTRRIMRTQLHYRRSHLDSDESFHHTLTRLFAFDSLFSALF